MIYQLIRPLLFCLPPEKSHVITQKLLRLFPPKKVAVPNAQSVTLLGLFFPNRVGLAAGWDKNGECIDGLFGLGFGFVEVGTVTPLPQPGNPKPRLFRLRKSRAIINRMGFNNKGVDYLITQLKRRKVPGILGVNIGKNKDTSNENAHEDYLICLEKVYPYADYVTINISSPNTPGLRDLHQESYLDFLLEKLNRLRQELSVVYHKRVPLLVKISPDFPHAELEVFLNNLLKHEINGVIATNTTVNHFGEPGGLSGAPLAYLSTEMIKGIQKITGNRLTIIGVGGIDSRQAAEEKFAAGAELIQLYTGLIYEGPGLIRQIYG